MMSDLQRGSATADSLHLIDSLRQQLPEHLRCPPSEECRVIALLQCLPVPYGFPGSSRTVEGSMPLTSAPPMTAVLDVPGWCQQTSQSPWPPISSSIVPSKGKYSIHSMPVGWIIQNDATYVRRILERNPDTLTAGNMLHMSQYFREHYQREPLTIASHTMMYTPHAHPGERHPWTITKRMLDRLEGMVKAWQFAHEARRPQPGCQVVTEDDDDKLRQMFLGLFIKLGSLTGACPARGFTHG